MSSINTIQVKTLWRDDDVSVHTDAYLFKKLHEQFITKDTVHTASLIMKDLWENQAVFWYLASAPLLEIGLHGWEHKDYSVLSYGDCYRDLRMSLDYWDINARRMLQVEELDDSKKIKIFFAPWNKESLSIREACRDLGLRFCNVKKGFWEEYDVRSFHWWSATMGEDFKL